jgi:Flp pilus assembly protein TadG
MKMKSLLCVIVAGSFALSSAFCQTAEMTGTVTAVSRSSITLQNGTETWVIQRVPSTKVTGDLKVGSTVTVSYNQPDAQKKEAPLGGTPTAAPK